MAKPKDNKPKSAPDDARVRASRLQFGREELFVLSLPVGLPTELSNLLSPSEAQVVEQVLEGLSNTAIADARNRHPRTVANQLASAYRKLGVGSRSELIGLVRPV